MPQQSDKYSIGEEEDPKADSELGVNFDEEDNHLILQCRCKECKYNVQRFLGFTTILQCQTAT